MLGLNERNGEGGNVPVCVCECLHARVCKGACEYIRESLLKGCLYVCVSVRVRERRGGEDWCQSDGCRSWLPCDGTDEFDLHVF